MNENPELSALILKFKNISSSDFLLASVAAKLDAFEIMLVERLVPVVSERERVFAQIDSDYLSILDVRLAALEAHAKLSDGSGQSGDQPPSNN